MTITRKQILTLMLLAAILFALPVVVILTRMRQDIRPRALQGKANFMISTDSNSTTVGKTFDVLINLQLVDPNLRVSGVDFLLLYDKAKLDVRNIVPAIQSIDPKNPFTDAPMVSSGGIFDSTFNFIRVSEITRMPDNFLPSGTFTLAKITFQAKAEGAAVIKFPDDDKYLEIVGSGTYISPTVVPTSVQTTTVNLKLVPATATFSGSNNQTVQLVADFTGGTSTQKLDYFRTEIDFPKDSLKVPDGVYIDVTASGFTKVFRVDGPTAANSSGKIVIELGANMPGSGPSTDKPITIGTITFTGLKAVTGQNITIGTTQAVDNKSVSLTINPQGTVFSVGQ